MSRQSATRQQSKTPTALVAKKVTPSATKAGTKKRMFIQKASGKKGSKEKPFRHRPMNSTCVAAELSASKHADPKFIYQEQDNSDSILAQSV
jgi:hypothetical protein